MPEMPQGSNLHGVPIKIMNAFSKDVPSVKTRTRSCASETALNKLKIPGNKGVTQQLSTRRLTEHGSRVSYNNFASMFGSLRCRRQLWFVCHKVRSGLKAPGGIDATWLCRVHHSAGSHSWQSRP